MWRSSSASACEAGSLRFDAYGTATLLGERVVYLHLEKLKGQGWQDGELPKSLLDLLTTGDPHGNRRSLAAW
jgi:hypothetical protein